MEGYNRDQRQSHSCEETVKPSIWRIKDKKYLKQNDPKWVYWLVRVEGSGGGFWPNPGMPAIHLVPQPQHASPAVGPLNSTGPLTAINYKLNVNKDWTLSQFKKEEITSLIYTPHICFMLTYFKFLILSWPYEKCTVHVSCFHPLPPIHFPLLIKVPTILSHVLWVTLTSYSTPRIPQGMKSNSTIVNDEMFLGLMEKTHSLSLSSMEGLRI